MYFQDFPVVPYPYYIGDDRKYALARNIIRRVALSEEINNTAAFIEYSIQDGERPEHIAQRVYGDSNHHWIILLTNNIVDPYHGWCKSQTTIEQYIQKRYSGEMIYFSDASQGFTYDFTYSDGCLLTQGGNSEPITSYRETFCELGVQTPKFSVGAAAITLPSGATTGIHIRKVVPAYLGVNHFSIDRPTGTVDGSNGALETPIVDPLALQSADYETTGVVLGNGLPATQYALSPSNLLTNQTLSSWEKINAGTGSQPVYNGLVANPNGDILASSFSLNKGTGTSTTSDYSFIRPPNNSSGLVSVTSGAPYTFSVWLKGNVGGEVILFRSAAASPWTKATLTTSWQRFSVTENAHASTIMPVTIGLITTTAHGTINSSIAFSIWAPQLESGSTATLTTTGLRLSDNTSTGAVVEFWQTYIGKYMGVSGSEVTNFATSNYQYETDSNEAKRTIKILSPVFLNQALKELKSVLGV